MKRLLVIVGLLWNFLAPAAERIPPAPDRYFNDNAKVVSPAVADRLNRTLEDFEKQTSIQIVVAVYSHMESDSSIEDYAVRVFRAWKPGEKGTNNAAVLLVFVRDHRMNITAGYGLESVLPDALCKQIIDNEIAPRLKAGDYDGGLSAGVAAMIAATRGEYKGTGRTVDELKHRLSWLTRNPGLIFMLLVIVLSFFGNRRRQYGGGWTYTGGGWGGGGGFGGGGFGGGGGFSGGGGGGFSGGGGSTGGGGASGSW